MYRWIAYINIYCFCSSPSAWAALFDAFSAASAARISSNFSDFVRITSIFGFCLDLVDSSPSSRLSMVVVIFFTTASSRLLRISATVTRELIATPRADSWTSPFSCKYFCAWPMKFSESRRSHASVRPHRVPYLANIDIATGLTCTWYQYPGNK